jgi:multiple sugar transport system ATP-binding protein
MTHVRFDAVTKEFAGGLRAVDQLDLSIDRGEFMVLVGPSGCGKTTALRMTAGLEAITDGTISIDGRVVNDVPSAKRDIAMVFQNYALYPHMTVFENMAFGLQQRRMRKRDLELRVREIARLLELEPFLSRKPKALSGGQRQRVAMGRAIVRRPSVFLMDEPLSNLDAKLRVQMRAEIRALQRRLGVTTIYVTHDQVEAMTMGDRVAVMRAGELQQVATPQQLYRQPANLFVAGFIGSPAMNLVEGSLQNGVVEIGHGGGRRVAVGIRPEHLRLERDGLRASVTHVEDLGAELIVHAEVDAAPVRADDAPDAASSGEPGRARLVARLEAETPIRVGDEVGLGWEPKRLHLFDLVGGESIGAGSHESASPGPPLLRATTLGR